jgi:hypothetical protein
MKFYVKFHTINETVIELDPDVTVSTLNGKPKLARDCTPEETIVIINHLRTKRGQMTTTKVQCIRDEGNWKSMLKLTDGNGTPDPTMREVTTKRVGQLGRHQARLVCEAKPTELRSGSTQRGWVRLHVHPGSIMVEFAPYVKAAARRVHRDGVLALIECEIDGAEAGYLRSVVKVPTDRTDEAVRLARSYLTDHGFSLTK